MRRAAFVFLTWPAEAYVHLVALLLGFHFQVENDETEDTKNKTDGA